jgi:serine/threonine protein kinase
MSEAFFTLDEVLHGQRPTGTITHNRTVANDSAKHHPLKRVGSFVIGSQIGNGAYGRVYKGVSVTSGRFAAIKQLRIANDGQARFGSIAASELASIMVCC